MQMKNVRFIIAAITTFSAYAIYVSRVNLSIAIIAMVEDQHERASHTHAAVAATTAAPFGLPPTLAPANEADAGQRRGKRAAEGDADTLPPVALYSEPKAYKRVSKFKWDQTEQGHILGAFFYGYILFQIPGARLAESVGAKWIIMAASAGSAVISLVFPLATTFNSIRLLMLLRFIMGLCQSAFFPAAYVLYCRWLPERERALLLPIMFVGANVGSVTTYIMSSYLINALGWPSVFLVAGLVCTVCAIGWLACGSNCPQDNWLITDAERKLIETADSESKAMSSGAGADTLLANGHSNDATAASQPQPFVTQNTPSWSKLLGSLPVWTFILTMYGNEWSHAVIAYELPTYLNTALSFPIEQNGPINSFFQLSYSLASPVMSSLGAYALTTKMPKLHVRKIFQSLATFGQMACFLSVPLCGANRGLIIMFMFFATVFKACANAGDIMISGDLSPEYAGTIYAFANSVGNTAGFFVPLLAGAIVNDAYERVQWTPFWLTSATILACSGLIFLVLGDTSRHDFSRKQKQATASSAEDGVELKGYTCNDLASNVSAPAKASVSDHQCRT